MPEEKVFPRLPGSPLLGKVADGVWLLRGEIGHAMNVYFLEDGSGGVVQFDAGVMPMRTAVRSVGARLGGVRRIILGHADSDHRGTAPYVGAPVYCHPDEVEGAEARGPYRPYWDMTKLTFAPVRWIYPLLHHRWDGGPVEVADTVSEGDVVCGFEVLHFPGHAPGLIGLWRESDRLAIVSDTIYLVDSERLKPLPEGEASIPIPAWDWDVEKTRRSARKLAELRPLTVCVGHEPPVSGAHVVPMIEAAAERYRS
ncbi:MAG TPA: MBL fold metallo-hydrolase [Solirubrobacterales bacterium]|nr:MBL fold metallo-hydrolase [Solirubrobacterales bacterium]